jgi:hypothetical protein
MGLIRRPATATTGGGSRGRCTPAVLFSRDGLGGAIAESEEEPGAERVDSRDLGRGGNRRSSRQDLVTVGVQVTVPCWEWQEPAGLAEKCKNVQETTEIRGQSWRKLLGQERVGPRNSSGSLTS